MWPRLFLTAAIIITVVRCVSAQTGTADGVAALARGDYQRAAEILKPIAEDWLSNDTAAQFFMAGLYQTGRGVPGGPAARLRAVQARGEQARRSVRSGSLPPVCRGQPRPGVRP